MRRHHARRLLPVTLALATAIAGAQGAPASAPPQPRFPADPLDAKAEVPQFIYRSSLATYRRLGEDESVPWREANGRVGRIGGWRAYAREANAPDAREGAQPSGKAGPEDSSLPMPKPMPGPHGGPGKR